MAFFYFLFFISIITGKNMFNPNKHLFFSTHKKNVLTYDIGKLNEKLLKMKAEVEPSHVLKAPELLVCGYPK